MPHTPKTKNIRSNKNVPTVLTCDVCGYPISPDEKPIYTFKIFEKAYTYAMHKKCHDITHAYINSFVKQLIIYGLTEGEINAFISCYLKGIMKK